MSAKNNIVLKAGFWYTIASFLTRGMGFITTPIFTRLLTQEEFGAFSNYTSWIGILTIIVTLNVEATLISARYDFEEKLDEYILSVLSLSLFSTSIWWLVSNLFVNISTDILNMNSLYMNSMFLYIVFLPAVNLFQTREQFFYKYKVSVAMSLLLSVGTSLFSVLLVVLMSNHLDGRVLGMVLPTLVIGLILFVYFVIKGKRVQLKYWKYALKIVLPYIPHLLSLTILGQIDRIMITDICGERENALYSLAYTVAMVITILLTALNSAFAPWLGENLSKKNYMEIRKVSKGYILLFVYFAFGLMLLSPEVLLFLGGESYLEAKWVMVPVAIGCICQFMYALFVNVEQFEKKTIGMAFASVSAAILNYVLNWLMIPQYGYIAAAFTTLVGYLWLLLVHMFLVYKMKMSQVYSYRFIFVVIMISLLLAALIYVLYIATMIRYVVTAIYIVGSLAILWINKEKLLSFIKNK